MARRLVLSGNFPLHFDKSRAQKLNGQGAGFARESVLVVPVEPRCSDQRGILVRKAILECGGRRTAVLYQDCRRRGFGSPGSGVRAEISAAVE
ncbi:MAG: hypothetical protein EHM61_08600 [Acidobacteria bacterium]|nr:MAG: hypothetical protein EHM61_08600 [Acidobacteriota bacterium]